MTRGVKATFVGQKKRFEVLCAALCMVNLPAGSLAGFTLSPLPPPNLTAVDSAPV